MGAPFVTKTDINFFAATFSATFRVVLGAAFFFADFIDFFGVTLDFRFLFILFWATGL